MTVDRTRSIQNHQRRTRRFCAGVGGWTSLLLCLVVAASALTGCGSKAATRTDTTVHHATVAKSPQGKLTPAAETAAAPIAEPDAIVARVGASTLTQKALQHLVGLEVLTEPPTSQVALIPPDFSACVAKLEASATASFSPSGGSSADYLPACAEQYEELRSEALKQWIVGEWVIHGADEVGAGVSEREVLATAQQLARETSPSFARLAASVKTKQDTLRQVRVSLANASIRAKIRAGTKITPADVSAYYRAHKLQFKISQTRDLEILRTKTKAEAERAKREIAHGRSFESLAKASSLPQPVYSHDGFVHGLKPGTYHETAINQAIFGAHPNMLGGPVKIYLGWYVFKVKAIHWGHQQSLGEVAKTIEQTLPRLREKQDLAGFIKRWRAKWRSRTSCSPGYVVEKCREAVPAKGAPEDLYTLA